MKSVQEQNVINTAIEFAESHYLKYNELDEFEKNIVDAVNSLSESDYPFLVKHA